MAFDNLNNTLIGRLLIIISVVLLICCLYMVFVTTPSSTDIGETIEWEGMHFYILWDSEYSIEGNSLIITSKYNLHNVQLEKTDDLSTYKEKFSDITSFAYYPRDSEHMILESMTEPFAIIVKNEDFNNRTNTINDGAEIIQVTAEDQAFLQSFIANTNGYSV